MSAATIPAPANGNDGRSPEAEALLLRMFDAAVASAQPERCVPPALPAPMPGRTIVIGAGKAAAAMARAVEDHWAGPLEGMVITRYGHAVGCERIAVREAGHPVPDAAGVAATQEMLGLLSGLTEQDLVLCLLSGGGSALMPAPPPGITLAELRALSRSLLRAGASIAEMNCVRKHLSLVAGGRLALLCAPARLATLIISDVPGDDPATIASGPTTADPTTRAEACAVLDRYAIATSPAIRSWLESPAAETPKAVPGTASCKIIASARGAMAAAASIAHEAGCLPIMLGDAIEGEARDVAAEHAEKIRKTRLDGCTTPCVILSGGETSVTVRSAGRGGRNSEYLLALALALADGCGVHALAADTDGIDGTEDNAGALIWPGILANEATRTEAAAALAASDSYIFFADADALVITGPTRTNVNDFRALLVEPTSRTGSSSWA